MKEMISKILFWGSWWFVVIISGILSVITYIPMTIYGLINECSFRETTEAFWIEGFYTEYRTQYERFKGMGL